MQSSIQRVYGLIWGPLFEMTKTMIKKNVLLHLTPEESKVDYVRSRYQTQRAFQQSWGSNVIFNNEARIHWIKWFIYKVLHYQYSNQRNVMGDPLFSYSRDG